MDSIQIKDTCGFCGQIFWHGAGTDSHNNKCLRCDNCKELRQCSFCKTVLSLEELDSHTDRTKCTCRLCGLPTACHTMLAKHLKTCQGNDNNITTSTQPIKPKIALECTRCNKLFARTKHLLDHECTLDERICRAHKRLYCNRIRCIENRVKAWRYTLCPDYSNTAASSTQLTPTVLECQHCNEHFSDTEGLQKHTDTCSVRVYKCLKCNTMNTRTCIKTRDKDKTLRYSRYVQQCPNCSNTTASPQLTSTVLECEHCHEHFSKTESLQKHIDTCSVFKCLKCNTRTCIKTHVKDKKQGYKYVQQCPNCSGEYVDTDLLVPVIIQVKKCTLPKYAPQKVASYKCTYCSTTFHSGLDRMRRHIIEAHKCWYCKMIFAEGDRICRVVGLPKSGLKYAHHHCLVTLKKHLETKTDNQQKPFKADKHCNSSVVSQAEKHLQQLEADKHCNSIVVRQAEKHLQQLEANKHSNSTVVRQTEKHLQQLEADKHSNSAVVWQAQNHLHPLEADKHSNSTVVRQALKHLQPLEADKHSNSTAVRQAEKPLAQLEADRHCNSTVVRQAVKHLQLLEADTHSNSTVVRQALKHLQPLEADKHYKSAAFVQTEKHLKPLEAIYHDSAAVIVAEKQLQSVGADNCCDSGAVIQAEKFLQSLEANHRLSTAVTQTVN